MTIRLILEVVRDVRERGRDIEGCIKQWFTFVKPNFHRYVEPQRERAGECCTGLFLTYLTYVPAQILSSLGALKTKLQLVVLTLNNVSCH